ncbi:group II intron reverse transcriptase domain-containing protein [Candidatus Daviesbacteria bacterium]|nr:group II intron reverse transcriptase domain-containing protein [Candidatus Daviesbacteria bacterium]
MFNTLCNFEHLLNSYRLARRDNRYKRQVCKFDLFLEDNLFKLRWELLTNHYSPYPYTYFVVTDPKTRHVAAPNFRDRVFHHGLVSVIEPLFDKAFIEDAYACRKGRGTHFAKSRLKKFLQAARSVYGREKQLYILQCDITKFFPSISWDILIKLIEKKITDPKIKELILTVITTHKVFLNRNKIQGLPKEVISIEERKGLPIGNLTSQLFANVYLNELDHFVKENLREHWYGRYMDDFYIIHPDKEHLKQIKEKVRVFLWDNLRLTLHPKKSVIQNTKNGVAFVGYRTFYDHVLVRGSTLRRFQRKLKKKEKAVQKGQVSQKSLDLMKSSFAGHLNYANAYHLKTCLFDQNLP